MHRTQRVLVCLVALVGLLTLATGSASAFAITVTFDENGHGELTNDAGFFGALPWFLLDDPGPGGLPGALFYDMLEPPGLVTGDVLIFEQGDRTLSDVLRFSPVESSSGVFVYSDLSDDGDPSLADIGFPTETYGNVLSLLEVGSEGSNGVSYTPIEGQPGFVAGADGLVTYNFTSDVTPVPEPGTLLLLIGGLGVLGLAVRKGKK